MQDLLATINICTTGNIYICVGDNFNISLMHTIANHIDVSQLISVQSTHLQTIEACSKAVEKSGSGFVTCLQPYVCLSVCLTACLSVSLSVSNYTSVCLSVPREQRDYHRIKFREI
jgi:hypothetical protein